MPETAVQSEFLALPLPGHTQLTESEGTVVRNVREHPQCRLLADLPPGCRLHPRCALAEPPCRSAPAPPLAEVAAGRACAGRRQLCACVAAVMDLRRRERPTAEFPDRPHPRKLATEH